MKRFIYTNFTKIFDGDYIYIIAYDGHKIFGRLFIKFESREKMICMIKYGRMRKKVITDISRIFASQQIIEF